MSSDLSNADHPSSIAGADAPQWLVERTRHAARELDDCVEVNPDKLGGVPVLKGSRISVAQILAEIAEGQTVEAVADDFDLDVAQVKRLVTGLSVSLDQPMTP